MRYLMIVRRTRRSHPQRQDRSLQHSCATCQMPPVQGRRRRSASTVHISSPIAPSLAANPGRRAPAARDPAARRAARRRLHDHPPQRLRQAAASPGGTSNPASRRHGFGDRSGRGGDDWQAVRHRLGKGHSVTLVKGRQHEDIGRPVGASRPIRRPLAGKSNAPARARPPRSSAGPLARSRDHARASRCKPGSSRDRGAAARPRRARDGLCAGSGWRRRAARRPGGRGRRRKACGFAVPGGTTAIRSGETP